VGPGPRFSRHLAPRKITELRVGVAMGEAPRWLYSLPGVPSGWTAEISSAILWAQALDAFGTSRLAAGGVSPSALKLRGARRRWSPIAHHVSLRDLTALTSPDTFVGPGPRFSRHFVSRGSKHQYFGTSRGEIPRLSTFSLLVSS
jgi:hypothetical protein